MQFRVGNFGRKLCNFFAKKPLTSVSKRVPGVHGKEGIGEGLAEEVGKGLAKGWRGVGEGLAKGWQGLAKG